MSNKGTRNVPGPGNYQASLVDKTSAPKFGFGSSGRAVMNSTTNVPGPGSYKPMSVMGSEGPKNSMHSKLTYKPVEDIGGKTPGPGSYEMHLKDKK